MKRPPPLASFRAKKSLGQNFLMHVQIAERMVHAAGVGPADTVFEIGPGTGKLTRVLLTNAKKVIALEADERLYEKLVQTFATEIKAKKLVLHLGDIRTFDITTLPPRYLVVANIPYYLTGEIFRMFLETTRQPQTVALLVQKEVAERVARSKKESILSLSVKAYGTPTYAFTVPRGAFAPAPKVDSAVLVIRNISRKHFKTPAQEKRFFELLHAGFAHKRKLLGSNLALVGVAKDVVPPSIRAEDLAVTDWLKLSAVY